MPFPEAATIRLYATEMPPTERPRLRTCPPAQGGYSLVGWPAYAAASALSTQASRNESNAASLIAARAASSGTGGEKDCPRFDSEAVSIIAQVGFKPVTFEWRCGNLIAYDMLDELEGRTRTEAEAQQQW